MNEIARMFSYLRLDGSPVADMLKGMAVCRAYPKGTILVSPESEEPMILFLVAGLLRGYVVDKSGNEITDCFSFRYGDLRLNFMRTDFRRSDEYVEALENTVVISFKHSDLMPIIMREPALLEIYLKAMSDGYNELMMHKRMLCHTTAMERYSWFLDDYPGIIDRAPHRHIASFLNITPVTLSRLRREKIQN